MKAEGTTVGQFFATAGVQFAIPVYQRNYSWTLVQCQQLLHDARCVAEGPDVSHFLGSIVYVSDGKSRTSANLSELVIIDGQQRLTTLTLIFLAIHRAALAAGDKMVANKIYDMYLINKYYDNAGKLRLTENNQNILTHILSDVACDMKEFSSNNLVGNFKSIKEYIARYNYDSILEAVEKFEFVEINLDRNENPQRVFESMNSTGLALTQSDLIRNYILMGMTRQQQENVYRNYWQKIEEYARLEKNDVDMVSDFVRDYLTEKNIPKQGKVYAEFKKKYSDTSYETVVRELGDMKRFAKWYNLLINPANERDDDVKVQLEYMKLLKVNVANPFLLRVFDDFRSKKIIDKDVFIAVLETVQSYVFRRFIVGLETNALNKVFMNLHGQIDSDNYLETLQKSLCRRANKTAFPRDGEVERELAIKDVYNTDQKNKNYLLRRLENHNNKEKVVIDDNITIEHVFPQTPTSEWKKELGSEFGEMQEKMHTLANLTLTGSNIQMGNKAFLEKRDMEGGYKDSRLWLNKFLSGLDRWGVQELSKRGQLLTKRFIKIWSFPSVDLNDGDDAEISIFDMDSAAHLKVEYIIFRDETIVMSTLTDVYVHVISTLFLERPEVFLNSEALRRIIKLGNESDASYRSGQALNNGYVFEKSFGNDVKLENLKALLNELEFEDDVLLIKFKSSAKP